MASAAQAQVQRKRAGGARRTQHEKLSRRTIPPPFSLDRPKARSCLLFTIIMPDIGFALGFHYVVL